MTTYRVMCRIKHDKFERITEVGCVDAGGGQHRFSEDEAISLIESRQAEFYVERPSGHRVKVIVAVHEGRKYLKTEADGERPDNLLALPSCKTHVIPPPPPRSITPAHSHGSVR